MVLVGYVMVALILAVDTVDPAGCWGELQEFHVVISWGGNRRRWLLMLLVLWVFSLFLRHVLPEIAAANAITTRTTAVVIIILTTATAITLDTQLLIHLFLMELLLEKTWFHSYVL